MMNHTVPEFETDDDFVIRELPMKSTMRGNEDTMELLWQNGKVVMQRSAGNKKPETRPMTATRDFPSSTDDTRNSDMFMQEDEMATWLHYPTDDISLENYIYGNDLIYPPITATPASLPPLPPPSVMISSKTTAATSLPPPHRHVEEIESGKQKTITDYDYGSGGLQSATIIASNQTASGKALDSRASRVSNKPGPNYEWNIGGTASTNNVGVAGTSVGWDMAVCETSVTPSSNSCDLGGATMEPLSQKPLPTNDQKPTPTNDQKRKGRDIDDNDRVSEDVEFENADAQKQSHGGSTSKRSRATEVHNLSERRRRDRINEKMKELQELIPRCNKSDKASMLDEAIEYTKSLQMQVKMMSMGYNMVPMMYPSVQQYMPPMGMGMVPYPTMLPGSSVPNPAAATAHLGQPFPVPGFNMSPVTVAGPTTSQAGNMSDQMMNTMTLYSQNQPTVPNFAYPFQEYLGLHQTQLPLPQNQGVAPIETKPSTSKDAKNPDRQQTG